MRWVARWVVKLNRRVLALGFDRDWFLIPLGGLIGCAAGLAAQGYARLVALSESFFFGTLARRGLTGWGIWLVLVLPILGAGIVGLIKTIFRLPMISHGIPEVIEAMARHNGRLPKRLGVFTAVNSAIMLGSGGSVGQEGPIVQIGSVVGSTIGRWFRVDRRYMSTLIGCGGAAGLAAIFNAPIAGVMLVLEVVLRDWSPRTFMPIIVASVFAVAVNQTITDRSDAIFKPPLDVIGHSFHVTDTLPYLLLGLVCGVVGWTFKKSLYGTEHVFQRSRLPLVVKPMIGALGLGLMGLLVVLSYRWISPTHGPPVPEYAPPPFFGNGYRVIQRLLAPDAYLISGANEATIGFWFLLFIVIGKLLGTSLSLGSGGSGGLFAPNLFIGAAVGALFGVCVRRLGLTPHISPAAYALAGLAGVLTGAVHCPLTAILLTFEITRDYQVILPVMLVSITAMTISQLLLRPSIYELALKEMGLRYGTRADLTVLRRMHVDAVPLVPAALVRSEEPATRLLELAQRNAITDFAVTSPDGKYTALVPGEAVRDALLSPEAMPLMIVGELMKSDIPALTMDETLDSALDKFAGHDVSSLAVVDAQQHVQGMLTRARLMRAYHAALGE